MDKTKEYTDILVQLSADSSSSADSLLKLRNELVPILENEKSKDGRTISDEVLRQYIKISRDIRKHIFDSIDTHVLTIEHLSDHILCRRRALEKNVPKQKPVENTTNKLAEMTKGMTLEEMEQFLTKLKGT